LFILYITQAVFSYNSAFSVCESISYSNSVCGGSIGPVKMSSHLFGIGRKPSIVIIFRLLIVSVLLSGRFVFQSSSQCLVLAGDDKDDGKDQQEDDKDKDKNNKKDYSEFPSEQQSMHPSRSPSRYPTRYPTQIPTTKLPTSSPTGKSFEAQLPEIKIDILTVVDDIFLFAALLLDGDVSGISNNNTLNNKNCLNAYFESFVVDLLIASEVVTSSSLDMVDIEIKFLPLNDEDEDKGIISSSPTTPTNEALMNVTPVRIAIEGKMVYHLEDDDGETSDYISYDVMLLEDKMSHTLAVYFSFWRTDEMLSKLSEYGLTDPRITAVRVDDKLILVAANTNPLSGGDTDSDNNNDAVSGGNNGNMLVAPTNIVTGIENSDSSSTAQSGDRALRRTGPFITLVAIAGSTMVILVSTIFASE